MFARKFKKTSHGLLAVGISFCLIYFGVLYISIFNAPTGSSGSQNDLQFKMEMVRNRTAASSEEPAPRIYYGSASTSRKNQMHFQLTPVVPALTKQQFASGDESLSALKPVLVEANSTDTTSLHAALIFDEHRISYAKQVIRSVNHYSKKSVIFHLVAPKALYGRLETELVGVDFRLYDYSLCLQLVDSVLAFSNPDIHVSAHCKLFLPNIIPVDKVLYIDNDVTAVQDISRCYSQPMNSEQMIGMGIDMGEVCQHHPNVCWPMAYEWKVAPGLVCGNAIERWSHMMRYTDKFCRSSGQMEPVQFNGGVMLLHLAKMRASKFVERYIAVVIRTARITGFKKARWGEQEFINSFFRVFPETLVQLPCGCNYQFTAIRREVKCPSQPIYLAHGWTSGVKTSNSNQFNRHFQHFLNFKPESPNPPPKVSLISSTFPNLKITAQVVPTHNKKCPHQTYDCSDDAFWDGGVYVNDTVYVLTRTSGRPLFYQNARESVTEQSYPNVVHIVGTDDPTSAKYVDRQLNYHAVKGNKSDLFKPLQSDKRPFSKVDVTIYPTSFHGFNPNEICQVCARKKPGGQDPRSCANAPGLDKPKERDEFLQCFCDTNYPMNQYINLLHGRIPQPANRTLFLEQGLVTKDSRSARIEPASHENGGWIIYLDDDNIFMSRHAIMEAMARVKNRKELVLWKSQLGRITPSNLHFGKAVVRGDVDASGFMYHSVFTNASGWSDKRCGDFRTADNLSKFLPVRWLDLVTIGAQPLRAKLGGLGMRADTSTMVSVVIQYDVDDSIQRRWLSHIVDAYTSQEQYANIVMQVVILAQDSSSIIDKWDEYRSVLIADANTNLVVSGKGKGLHFLDLLETEAVLVLQNDVFVTKSGMTGMLAMWQSNNRQVSVGPFPLWVGQNQLPGVQNNKKQWLIGGGLDDIMRGDKDNSFSFPSSRLLLLSKSFLRAYFDKGRPMLAKYIKDTNQNWLSEVPARRAMLQRHFRDLAWAVFGIVSGLSTPGLLQLPEHSVYDFRDICDDRLEQSMAYANLTNEERLLLANPLTQPLLAIDPQHLNWFWTTYFAQIVHEQSGKSVDKTLSKIQQELAKAQVILHPSKMATAFSGPKGNIMQQRVGVSGFSQQAWKDSFSTEVWCMDLFS